MPVTHVPGIFYLIALNVIVAHDAALADKSIALVTYNAVWFALPLAALVVCIVRPASARALVASVDRWAQDEPEAIEKDVANSRLRIASAPAVIAVCCTLSDMDRYPDARRAEAERLMAVQSTAMAVQNLLLLAHAEGLAACWMCAPLFCPETVRTALALPPDWQPQALITLGYSAAPGRKRERRAIAEFVRR